MKICGFQKLTLLDYPEKTAATLFTGGCNFRCPFCHNGDLVLGCGEMGEIKEVEIFDTLRRRLGFLDGVCITGGEPLMWQETEELIRDIKDMGYLVKVDTNGSYPDRLERLISSGMVDYVAMDIKNSIASYPKTVGLTSFDTTPVERSVELLKKSDLDHEFRTTLVKNLHTEKDMEEIGLWLKGEKKYFLQAFKKSDNVIDDSMEGFEKEELEKMLEIVRSFIPTAQLRGV
ncbi:MAG: anaerobic ribonucleoside-triphosphate reductase activating protein [Clostridia bacterium]|nr:anaerobic ribonucleoside-triphosphate reductase activating protein [Clostridia bacterium]